MKGFAAVARREFTEHRSVLWAALASGLLAAVIPAFQARTREIREIAAMFVGVSFAGGLALALGISVVAAPLADRRLSFYFARPLTAASIWGGKLAGVAALVFAAELASVLPSAAANGFAASRDAVLVLAEGLLFSIAVLLPIAHAIGIAGRSRSRWLGLDFAGVAILVLAAVLGSRRLVRELAVTRLNVGLAVLAIIALAGIVAGGFAAVSRGRTDLDRAHCWLSVVVWSVLLPAATLWLAYSMWITSPRTGDLTRIWWASPAPRGELADVVGGTRWRGKEPSRFLVDLSTGRGIRLPSRMTEPRFSTDGRHAVSIEPQYAPRGFSVFSGSFGGIQTDGAAIFRLDLADGAIRRRDTGISVSAWPAAAALSPDGSRLAIASTEQGSSNLSVYDLSSARLLGAAPIPDANRIHLFFSKPDRVRIYADDATNHRAGELRVFELDITARRLEQLGETTPAAEYRFPRVNREGTRLLLVSAKRIVLVDARTAAEIVVLSSGPKWSRNAIFLADGRIGLAEGDAEGTRVRLFSPDGAEEKTVAISPPGRIALGLQPAAGKLVVSRRAEKEDWKESESLLVDLDTGALRSLGRHLFPAAINRWTGDPTQSIEAGSPGSTLFLDSAGRLLRVDPATGARRVLLPRD